MARPDQLSRRLAIVGLGCAFAVAVLLGASATRASADDVSPPATTVATPTDTVPSDPTPTPDRAPVTPASTPKKASAPASKATTQPVHPANTSSPHGTQSTQSTHGTLTPQSVQTPPVQHVSQPTAIAPAVTQHTASHGKVPAAHRTVHKKKVQPAASKAKPTPEPGVKRHVPAATNAPAPLPAVLPTALHTAPVKAATHTPTPALGLMLLVLGLVAVGFLALAAAPVSILRRPAVVRMAMHGRPVLGALGFSLLGAVVILYLLTETGA